MIKNISVGGKVALLVLSIVCFAVLILGTVFYRFVKEVIKNRALSNLAVITDLKYNQIETYFKQANNSADVVCNRIEREPNITSLSSEENKSLQQDLKVLSSAFNFSPFSIIDKEGNLKFKSEELKPNIAKGIVNEFSGKVVNQLDTLVFGNVFVYNTTYILPFQRKLKNSGGAELWLVSGIRLNSLYNIILDTTGLKSTGEIMLGTLKNNQAIIENPLRFNSDAAFKLTIPITSLSNLALLEAVQKRSGTGEDTDYRGKNVLASWRYLPLQNWGLVVKVDQEEIFNSLDYLRVAFTGTGLFVVLLALVLAWVSSRILVEPLINLKDVTLQLAKGVLPERLTNKSNDEIGKISEALDMLVDSMKRTSQFANEIGSGNTNADYQLLSEYDFLGKSLIQMRDNLLDNNTKEDQRNWFLKGEAEASEIARSLQQNTQGLCNAIIGYICQQIDGVYGSVYILTETERNDKELFLVASYALHPDASIRKTFKIGEGLIGQAVMDKKTYFRTSARIDKIQIRTGLLDNAFANSIYVIPLQYNQQVVGAIEVAGLDEISQARQQFANAIAKVLAAAIYNSRINQRTSDLLSEQQQLTEELKVKQEILKRQTEEMKLAQASLREANLQLAEQFQEVKRSEKRIQVLMENATEIIAIYNEDGTIRYVSPSVEPILGYKPEELIRKDDNELVISGLDAVIQRRKELLENPEKPITIQFTYKNKKGEEVFIESRGLNMLHDSAINGIIVNARDVTTAVLAEKEGRMRSEMQALSENSTDIIARVNKFGLFFYINPTIEQYTGFAPSLFQRKRITDFPLSEIDLLKSWTILFNEVLFQRVTVQREVEFDSFFGQRVLTVTCVPELNKEGNIESVLIVSHDITERKLIEIEIQNKNTKITESITYAKRIQLAILPEENAIKRLFPKSFVVFKPKDVVSGDFVWSFQRDNDLYVAVIDCTGHGVPGALLSLIGFFLLEDITRKESEPAVILNKLDKGLTDSLRFNNAETGTRDGMDVALCKINLERKKLVFAGAHRPLYLQKGSQVLEIKGDKFPVGAMEFFGGTTYQQHEIEIESGNRLLMFSDGYADQFGGPDDKKYTAKRIRDVFANNATVSFPDLADLYNQEIEQWKGNSRQIDDILMVGIEL